MKATLVSKEKSDAKFTMEFTAEEFENAIKKAYQASKEKFRIDGFRKGKAPRSLIEKHYGETVFFDDAINNMFSQWYPKAIDQLVLEVIDQPRVEFGKIEKGKGFDITITVTVYPEVEVKDYKGVEIEAVDEAIQEEDVNQELLTLQKRNSRMIVVDRPVEDGDTVLVDFEGRVDGVQFEGGTAQRQPLKIGSGSFIPGFEEQLIGVKVGEEKDVKVTFPEDYQAEDLAGKEAVFLCKVHEVKEEELPELDDDFAKDVSEFDTLEELKVETREKLEKTAKDRAERQMRNAALEQVHNANDIDVPNVLTDEETDMMLNELDQQLRSQGMSMDQYLQYLQKDLKSFRNEMRPEATQRAKTHILLRAVADAENLQASPEDFEDQISQMAQQNHMEVEKLKELLNENSKEYMEKDIRNKKAIDFIYESAMIK